jgi:hypothetical protein
MEAGYARIFPILIAVGMVLLIYRRLRRSFGRQRIAPARMGMRIALLSLLACSMLPLAMRAGQYLGMEIAGLAAGAALGLWGAAKTRYTTHEHQWYYIPHTYTGVAVSLLFIARLTYRMAVLYATRGPSAPDIDAAASYGLAPGSIVRSPLTVGLLFVVIGYYVCYYGCVLWKYKRIGPEELEAAETARGPPP